MPNAEIVASAGDVRGAAGRHGPDLQLAALGDDGIDLGGLSRCFAL